MTTFTYEPLIGLVARTDEDGNSIYYEYDSLNRLSIIRDMDKNIVKHYEYNYRVR